MEKQEYRMEQQVKRKATGRGGGSLQRLEDTAGIDGIDVTQLYVCVRIVYEVLGNLGPVVLSNTNLPPREERIMYTPAKRRAEIDMN